jgi:hypothetical protein
VFGEARAIMANARGTMILDTFRRSGSREDIDSAVAAFTEAARRCPDGSSVRPRLSNDLGVALLDRYYLSGDAADLTAAVQCCERSPSRTFRTACSGVCRCRFT